MKKYFICFMVALPVLTPWPSFALDAPPPGTTYAYPLPATVGFVSLVYNMAGSGSVHIQVFDEARVLISDLTETKASGGLQSSQVCICGTIPPGIYFYLVTLAYDSGTREKLKVGKFVVTR
jgi:hypothetical protein